jgi:hypothetical protein
VEKVRPQFLFLRHLTSRTGSPRKASRLLSPVLADLFISRTVLTEERIAGSILQCPFFSEPLYFADSVRNSIPTGAQPVFAGSPFRGLEFLSQHRSGSKSNKTTCQIYSFIPRRKPAYGHLFEDRERDRTVAERIQKRVLGA